LEQDNSDGVWRHQILSDTGSEVLCNDRYCRKEDLGDPMNKYLMKNIENRLHLKKRFYRF